MTWAQLLDWINDPTRTQAELQTAATALGLNPAGTIAQLQARLRGFISRHPMTTLSTWTPPGWVAPGTPAPASAPLSIVTPSALPNAQVGVAYNQPLNAVDGTMPYTWTNATPLPAWLTLNVVGGNASLQGMPGNADVGPSAFTIRATDTTGTNHGYQAFTLQVQPAPAPVPPAPAVNRDREIAMVAVGGLLLLILLGALLWALLGRGTTTVVNPASEQSAQEYVLLNGQAPIATGVNSAAYQFIPYADIEVPSGYTADAHIVGVGVRYDIKAGSKIRVTDITLKRTSQ